MLAPTYFPTHEYAVSLAMRRLTSGFGMEPGVPASLWEPANLIRSSGASCAGTRYRGAGSKFRLAPRCGLYIPVQGSERFYSIFKIWAAFGQPSSAGFMAVVDGY